MSDWESRFAALEKEVQYLRDRREIEDLVHGLGRAMDRFDVEVMTESYHDDALDDHGSFARTPAKEFAAWANAVHDGGSTLSMHNICTHNCEIGGDTAHTESYVMGAMLDKNGETCRFLNGRYLDRLEKRDGKWRIALRRCTVDVVMRGDASMMQTKQFKSFGMIKGTRDKNDPSFARPLTMETPVDFW